MLTANRAIQLSMALIATIILLRLVSLGLYPLFDTTEARYGEIARIMFETRNWVTPQFDYNIPFWGKPPLHTWASAISFSIFGVSEFAARLPHFVSGLITCYLVYLFMANQFGKDNAVKGVLILTTCLGFQIATGMVMTDSLLLLSITIAMLSFYHCYFNHSFIAGIFFFLALSIGMLAKGPVAIVLVGIPLTLWSIHSKVFWASLKSLPWLIGLTLFALLTVPWYLLAELRTPGFLDYFLWGEHVERFLVSGWQGDLYGSAHKESKDTIWLFWLAVAFPWSFVFLWLKLKNAITKINNATTNSQSTRLTHRYFVYWLLSPMMLFTLAGNILPAYVLPSLPALAILIALSTIQRKTILQTSVVSASLILFVMAYFISGSSSKVSHQEVLKNLTAEQLSQPLYYWMKRPFSAQFYSNGAAQKIASTKDLIILDEQQKPFIFVVNQKHKSDISVYIQSQCTKFEDNNGFSLYQCGK